VDESAVMTLRQVADYLHCHMDALYKLAQDGEIPCFKLGGNWRVLKSDIDLWVANGGAPPRSYRPKPKNLSPQSRNAGR
jgi:excisionase family DNA binding protein